MNDLIYIELANDQAEYDNANEIIKYFNNANLTQINTKEEFAKNEKAKVFEKKLINRLNK